MNLASFSAFSPKEDHESFHRNGCDSAPHSHCHPMRWATVKRDAMSGAHHFTSFFLGSDGVLRNHPCWTTASSPSPPSVATCPAPEQKAVLPAPLRGVSHPTAFPKAASWPTRDKDLGERHVPTAWTHSLRLNPLPHLPVRSSRALPWERQDFQGRTSQESVLSC